jgi:shikimate dehydrogenase
MRPAPDARRCAVLGSPIRHSLSPTLHRAAYRHLGVPWSYEAIDMDVAGLESFVAGLDQTWRGLSLTMPLKEEAARLATHRSTTVHVTGVANTLVLDGGRREAHNTDVAGLRAALAERAVDRASHATIIGSGSTATSALAALASLTSSVAVVARSPDRARRAVDVADQVGLSCRYVPWESAARELAAPVVVSTTPAGATDRLVPLLPTTPGVLLDVVYDPWPTALARAWSNRGGAVSSGLDLLVHQAVDQVALMTGELVPVAVLREALGHR